VVGSLLSDLASGLDITEVKRNFAYQTRADLNQRPQAPPKEGNIRAAEDLIKKLNLAESLERRFAHMGDIKQFIWHPKQVDLSEKTVFSALRAGSKDLSAAPMTWNKFSKTVLSNIDRLDFWVPDRGSFIGLCTAKNKDAPPILKWDSEEERNPVSWYVYVNGSSASQWSLVSNAWVSVKGVTPFPNLWGSQPKPYLADGAILLLEGARDRHHSGLSLFPEILTGTLHSVRSTIEAYSRIHQLSGAEMADANGWDIRSSSMNTIKLRAHTGKSTIEYTIDRWD
jgi:hypothetical protein